jgi:hypothetical protein
LKRNYLAVIAAVGFFAVNAGASRADRAAPNWRLTGDLSEACSCSVPCSCNFGEAPTPHKFCYALYSLDIKSGNYGELELSGLRLAGAVGSNGMVWYIDERATKEQAAALTAISRVIYDKAMKTAGFKTPKDIPAEMRMRGIKSAKIEQIVTEKKNYLKIGSLGSFGSDYIMGLDGKTPVVVENNWSWNIQHGIKGKTKRLSYHDSYGNKFDFTGTNANQGKFDWSDRTTIYFR